MDVNAIEAPSGGRTIIFNRRWSTTSGFKSALCFLLSACFLTILFAAHNAIADDAYMKQLEAELSSGGGKVDNANKKGGIQSRSVVKEIEAESLDRPGFESTLESGHPSTFALYGKLEEHKKIQVYNEYRVTGSYKAVSKKVLRLLYGI